MITRNTYTDRNEQQLLPSLQRAFIYSCLYDTYLKEIMTWCNWLNGYMKSISFRGAFFLHHNYDKVAERGRHQSAKLNFMSSILILVSKMEWPDSKLRLKMEVLSNWLARLTVNQVSSEHVGSTPTTSTIALRRQNLTVSQVLLFSRSVLYFWEHNDWSFTRFGCGRLQVRILPLRRGNRMKFTSLRFEASGSRINLLILPLRWEKASAFDRGTGSDPKTSRCSAKSLVSFWSGNGKWPKSKVPCSVMATRENLAL